MKFFIKCLWISLFFCVCQAQVCSIIDPSRAAADPFVGACSAPAAFPVAHFNCERPGADSCGIYEKAAETCADEAAAAGFVVPQYPLSWSASTVTHASTSPQCGMSTSFTITPYDASNPKDRVTAPRTDLANFTVSSSPAIAFTQVTNPDGTITYTYTPSDTTCDPKVNSIAPSYTVNVTLYDSCPVDSTTLACRCVRTDFGGIGDPHYTTPDGRYFTYLGTGDYWLGTIYTTQIQVRLASCHVVGATCHVAIAFKVADGSHIVYYTGYTLSINNTIYASSPLPYGVPQAIATDTTVTQIASDTVSFSFPKVVVRIILQNIRGFSSLDLYFSANAPVIGGLFSPQGRNGEPWGESAALVEPFGNSWRVQNESESIFYYSETGESFSDVNQANAMQNYACELNPNGTLVAQQACADLNATSVIVAQCSPYIKETPQHYSNCMCDVMMTNLTDFAESTIEGYVLQCQEFLPSLLLPVSARHTIAYGPGLGPQVTVGQTQTVTIQAEDCLGQNSTIANAVFVPIFSNTPAFQNLTSNGDGTYELQYTMLTPGPLQISITHDDIAIDCCQNSINVVLF